MMNSPILEIENALEALHLPKVISRQNIKDQYHFLAKKNHPDFGGNAKQMETINSAYKLLVAYMDEFRYAFDEAEISKQFSGADYAQRFKH